MSQVPCSLGTPPSPGLLTSGHTQESTQGPESIWGLKLLLAWACPENFSRPLGKLNGDSLGRMTTEAEHLDV